MNKNQLKKGFTIVEIMAVILLIAILALIVIVGYRNVTKNAVVSTMQVDLSRAAEKIKIFQDKSPTNDFPTAINCVNTTATELCLTPTGSSVYNSYSYDNSVYPKTFLLQETNGTLVYFVNENSVPDTLKRFLVVTDPSNWMSIGDQVWAKANLNVGTRINGALAQTNNAVLEKYCHSDLEANCTTYGGLYQWNEVMQYVTTEGSQGICPANSHIPTDAEWKILEMYLGMSQAQADASNSWRGTNQSTQLRSGGSSGLNLPFAGVRDTNGLFYSLLATAYLWSSSVQSASNSWPRMLNSDMPTVGYYSSDKNFGFSLRCIGN